jgi:hypothetical protein
MTGIVYDPLLGELRTNDTAGKTLFFKADPLTVAFTATTGSTITIKAGTVAATPNSLITFAEATAVRMPSLTAGTDYAIYACDDGSLVADANFTAPSGYTALNSRKIGGFHYAPGGNATTFTKAAVTDGTALPAATVAIDKWALWRLTIVQAGTITATPAAGNAAGYASEALAIAALPSPPVSFYDMGYITVLTKSGTTFVAGTDALAGGSSGNVATTTNYYTSAGEVKPTLSMGSTDTAVASTAFTYWGGGDTTPAINPYSLWDTNFRPDCPDPRGKTLVANKFWSDIYLTALDAITVGSSKYNVSYADGASPPKMPIEFGGTGSSVYASYNWWQANELATAFGMRLPTGQEFSALAFGTTEASSVVSEQNSTKLNSAYTSKWGVIQASGVMYTRGSDRAGPYAAAAYHANGRGSEFNEPSTGIFGGAWYGGALSGSRCSYWLYAPSDSGYEVGSRFVCSHYRVG